ncbi:hypothetical protein Gasu2_20310 [Galdieria sulphuraria]|uniref:Uncharacterized protein n=1 Tax=Galdieria sulphuraria TaxID=130081 RepID=M2Y5Y0_GALSU|nr:uncharacterized protein Gasu_15040 [Galdieria sulphuraria]EME31264.1 hypothetical protein Gasu_15040 [Galdieria sulphuraria]GJD07685.1 hypothetical protein Gasu2_20310 [Galdieria sulphuraria]|eukprot:XP_005707784.1 hypothetical protein Gasu_15040 [Galdieria sulphuraria]
MEGGDMDNFFDSLESLQGQEEVCNGEALTSSEFCFYGNFREDSFADLELKHYAEEECLWQPKVAPHGAFSYTSGYNKTPERDKELLIDQNNSFVNTPVTDSVPETTCVKESLSWSSVGSSTNLDDEAEACKNLQSNGSCCKREREQQLFPLIEKLQFQVDLLKSENHDLRKHMGRISQENEILRSQLQHLQENKTLVFKSAKTGNKRQRPEEAVAVDSETISAKCNPSTTKAERRKRTLKSKTLFCFSIILGFFILPYFFRRQSYLDKNYVGIVWKNGSKPVTAIAKYIPYMEERSPSELVGTSQTKQVVRGETHFDSFFPAVRKSYDPSTEHWIRRAVEAAMQLADPSPEDVHNLVTHQKAEDFLRSYASWITHRRGSPTMLVITRDLVSVLPENVIENSSCPDPSKGNCDYTVSLLMPVRSFNESLSDCIYTSLECQLTQGKSNKTLCKC